MATYNPLDLSGLSHYDEKIKAYINTHSGGTPATSAQIQSLFSTPAPTVVAFDTATDSEITAIINAYYAGTLSLQDIQAVWSVGDTRDVSLSAIAATGTYDQIPYK